MEMFTKDIKFADLIHDNYNLLPVINRFGIRLGIKNKTIEDVCEETQIHTNFFLAIVNTFCNKNYFPQSELLSFSPLLIIEYLKHTHEYYTKQVLPKIEILLEQLISNCSENCNDINLIKTFYIKYKTELLIHIKYEEEKVFPYVINLVNNKNISDYSIKYFEKEHSNVELKLNDLKNLIIKYLEPNYNDNDCNEFLHALFHFENDIKDHARIENNILVPKVMELEKGKMDK